MVVKYTTPIRLSSELHNKLKEIKKKLMMMNGEAVSMKKLSKKIVQAKAFKDVEREILTDKSPEEFFKFDRRKI